MGRQFFRIQISVLAVLLIGNSFGSAGSARASAAIASRRRPEMTIFIGKTGEPNESSISFAGFTRSVQVETASAVSQQAGSAISCTSPVKIMPLGDSITKGSASGTVEAEPYYISYRKDLWESLGAKGYSIDLVGSTVSGNNYSGFDANHEGHPSWSAEHIRDNIYGSGLNWLSGTPADVILLHIGTNDINQNQAPADVVTEVSQILDKVNQYEVDHGTVIWVVLAQIINRSCAGNATCLAKSGNVSSYNSVLLSMANSRISAGDEIRVVNMETGAGIDYDSYSAGGDMFDELHPYASGYSKMAYLWEQELVNILPFARSDSVNVDEDSDEIALDVLCNDVGTSLTIQNVTTVSTAGTVTVGGGATILYQPASNFNGTDTFTYTIEGIGAASTDIKTGIVTVTVNPVNDQPEAAPDQKSVLEDQLLTFSAAELLANDSKGPENENSQTLSVAEVDSTGDTHGSLSLSGGTITYTPNPDYSGPASFNYTVCDDGSPVECSETPGVVDVTVTAVNDAPSFTKGFIPTVAEDSGAQVIAGWAKGISAGPNESGQVLTFEVSNDNPGLFSVQPAVDAQTGALTFTPAANAYGKAQGSAVLKDDGGVANGGEDTSAPQTFTITITAVNDPPVITLPAERLFRVGEAASMQVVAVDPDRDPLTFSATNLPPGLSMDPKTGLISGALHLDSAGSYTVDLSVSDGTVKASIKFTIQVNGVLYLPFMVG